MLLVISQFPFKLKRVNFKYISMFPVLEVILVPEPKQVFFLPKPNQSRSMKVQCPCCWHAVNVTLTFKLTYSDANEDLFLTSNQEFFVLKLNQTVTVLHNNHVITKSRSPYNWYSPMTMCCGVSILVGTFSKSFQESSTPTFHNVPCTFFSHNSFHFKNSTGAAHR